MSPDIRAEVAWAEVVNSASEHDAVKGYGKCELCSDLRRSLNETLPRRVNLTPGRISSTQGGLPV